MDQRSIAVLNRIASSDSYVPVELLAKVFNVSRRTIYNDFDKINYWLKAHNLIELKQVREKGFYLEEDTKRQVLERFHQFNGLYYEFSPSERKAWIYVYLVAHDNPIFLNDIKLMYQVSRNTALDDIKKLKNELSDYQIEVESERVRGYFVTGNENDIRKRLIHYLTLIIPENGWYSLMDNSGDHEMDEVVEPYDLFNTMTLSMLYDFINEYESEHEIEYTDDVLNNLVVWFYLIVLRVKQGNIIEVDPVEKDVIYSTSEFSGARKMSHRISQELNIEIPVDEMHYFAKYLLSSKVNYNFSPNLENQEMKSLRDVVEKMVYDFQINAAVTFPDHKHMIQNLLLHLKPAYYRSKYGISIENTLGDSVKQNYPEIFHLTKKVIHHFEDFIDKPVSESEVAFIAMHFGGWLSREGVLLGERRKKLLIVCTNGVGTSRLLESQLEGLFSDIDIVGVTSLREYEKVDVAVDFIISTIPLNNRGVPVIVVNPVLNNHDKEQLLKKVNSLFQRTTKQQLYSVDTVMDMVKRYAAIREEDSLRDELRQYFHSPLNIEDEAKKPNLNELLPGDRIVFEKRLAGWEDAVKKASTPLLNQGYIEEKYIAKMIENIKSYGPYIVISEGVALPHATASDGVNKTGISMLHVDDPVDVLGEEAVIFIVLAPRDNEQHLKALAQLTRLFSNKSYKKNIFQATNSEQIVNMIRTDLTE